MGQEDKGYSKLCFTCSSYLREHPLMAGSGDSFHTLKDRNTNGRFVETE